MAKIPNTLFVKNVRVFNVIKTNKKWNSVFALALTAIMMFQSQ